MSAVSVPMGTKQCVPRLPDPWLVRARLNDRCGKVEPGEAMLVAAFAGSGKTTLLADWFTNDCRVADRVWLTVDARDNAPGRLSSLLARALGAGGAVEDLDGRLCSDLLVLDRVFEHMAARDAPTVLVLDDVHELTSRPALAALSHLLVARPPALTVFLAARADPPLPLARMQVEGRLHQIRAADLAFTAAETAEVFERHGVQLSASDVALLHERTGGWAAGVRLAALSLVARADLDDVVDNIVRTDAVIADYLVHEVLDGQSPEMRRFLLRTCLAQPLTEELARELTGEVHAAALLEQLERSGVFVTQTADGTATYRFHSLFGELLRARIRHDEPALARSLQTRAAHWYVDHDLPLEAEQHAYEAADFELAGDLSCRRFVREALAGVWMRSAPGAPPADATARVPELAFVAAVDALAAFDQRDARMWRSRLDTVQPIDDTKDDWLRAARLLLDVGYGRAFGTDARALESCAALLTVDLGPDTALLHALARLREAELLLDADGDDEEATLRALLDGRARASRIAARWIVDECDVLLAVIAAVRGRLDSCDTLLEQVPPRRDDDPVADTRALARALCDAQRGRLNTARWALEARPGSALTPRAIRVGIGVAVAELEASDGAPSPAGDHAFAGRVAVALGALGGVTSEAERTVVEARALLAKQRDRQALEVLEPLLAQPGELEHLRTEVEAAILAAVAADRLDDHDRALLLLGDALEIAAPVDLRAPFQANVGLLGGVIDRYSWQLAGTSAYAAELLDDLHPEEFPVFVEPLTARERAVLEYLPTMMTNTEIARQLLVSVNTVKTHLKAVYRKLGVTRRREAVLRAKQLEIL
jgi:LuxR family maltose regulon positive regulatory protein